jgi:hypothetical protein
LIYAFNFQNSQGNTAAQTKFYINFGIHSPAIDRVIGSNELPQPKEYECHYRKRISTITKSPNDGYYITTDTDLQALANTVVADLKTALQLLGSIHTTTNLVDLMIEQNGLDRYCELFKYLLRTGDEQRLKYFVQTIHRSFGTEKRWRIFESNLNDVLKENKRADTVYDLVNK